MKLKIFLLAIVLFIILGGTFVNAATWSGYTDNANKTFFHRLNSYNGSSFVDNTGKFNITYTGTFNWINTNGLSGFSNYTNTTVTNTLGNTSFNPTATQLNNFSLEFRIKSNDVTRAYLIGSATGADGSKVGFSVIHSSLGDGKPSLLVSDGAIFPVNEPDFGCPISLSDGNWHHVVITKNASNVWKIYEDGVACSSPQTGQIGATSTDSIVIHNRPARTSGFNGALDQIIWWNHTLDINQIIAGNNSDSDGDSSAGLTVTLSSPTQGEIITTSPLNFTSSANSNVTIVNATTYIWYSNGTLFTTNTSTLTGLSNATTHSIGGLVNNRNYMWNAYYCDIENCVYRSSNVTFSTGARLDTSSYNSTSYYSASENYLTNIATLPGDTIQNAIFQYNNINYTGTIIQNNATSVSLIKSWDVPSVGSVSWRWILNYSDGNQQALSSNTQTIADISLNFCNTTNTFTYVNFSFKNETTSLQTIKASITSTWTYWLGSGTVNRTLSFTNSSESFNYQFCFIPQNRSVNYDLTFNYYNGESPQRTYTITRGTLANTTAQQTLYLLPASVGLYTRYRVVTSGGTSISGAYATVSTTLGGTSVQIASGYTDSSGQVVFWLNPDSTYDYTFSYGGVSTSFSLQPNSLETYTVTLGQGVSTIPSGSLLARNLSYTFGPSNSTLQNNTLYTFSFNVTGTSVINFISMNITNGSTQLAYTSGVSAGTISVNLNTANNTRLFAYYTISSANETITLTNSWTVGSFYEGDYSIYRQFTLFANYGFSDFIRILLALFAILGIMAFLSINDITDTSESKILVGLLLVWAFSIVGWLDTGLATTSTNQGIQSLSQYSSKYGIAIMSSVFSGFFIGRRLFT